MIPIKSVIFQHSSVQNLAFEAVLKQTIIRYVHIYVAIPFTSINSSSTPILLTTSSSSAISRKIVLIIHGMVSG